MYTTDFLVIPAKVTLSGAEVAFRLNRIMGHEDERKPDEEFTPGVPRHSDGEPEEKSKQGTTEMPKEAREKKPRRRRVGLNGGSNKKEKRKKPPPK